MATQHVNASTFTTATSLITIKQDAARQTALTVYNGHSAAIFIGDATITTSGATIGRTLPAASTSTFWVSGGDVIYGISASASAAGAIVFTYSA